MTDTTPADQLRAAADRAHEIGDALHRPLAKWLHLEARRLSATTHPDWQTTVAAAALAVARQLLGTGEQADTVAPVAAEPETDEEREQREDREAIARDHTAGDHGNCDVTCEVEMPSDMLRNFIVAKGYPGTGGALDELLRRAATRQPDTVTTAGVDRAAILREAADHAESLRLFGPAFGFRKDAQISENVGILRVADHLRRLADEAQQPEAAGCKRCGCSPRCCACDFAEAQQPTPAVAETRAHHTVDGTRYLCHTDDHYCPQGAPTPAPTEEAK